MDSKWVDLMFECAAVAVLAAVLCGFSAVLYWAIPTIWQMERGQFTFWSFYLSQILLILLGRSFRYAVERAYSAVKGQSED